MQTTTTIIISPRNCKYTLNGDNIAGFRRTRLHSMAKALACDGDFSKNELLLNIIDCLKAMQAPNEIMDIMVPDAIDAEPEVVLGRKP